MFDEIKNDGLAIRDNISCEIMTSTKIEVDLSFDPRAVRARKCANELYEVHTALKNIDFVRSNLYEPSRIALALKSNVYLVGF